MAQLLSAGSRRPGSVLQVLIYLRRGDGTFADSGGDAFDRAVADIGSGEHSWHAGFQPAGSRALIAKPAFRTWSGDT